MHFLFHTPLQPIPPPSLYIPFRTITTPISKQPSLFVTITTHVPSLSVTIPIIIESTITIIVPILSETITTAPVTTTINPPQIPPTFLSQFLDPNENTTPEQTSIIIIEQPS